MKRIVIIPNKQKDPDLTLTGRVIAVLSSFCSAIYMENDGTSLPSGVIGYSAAAFPDDAELLLVLGGDGTILHAAETALQYNIPILGINMGRLGYLASLEPTELDILKNLACDSYTVKTHMTLSVCRTGGSAAACINAVALNDVVISGAGHLADMLLYDGTARLSYRGDGLILATPTGSTAYSLSAGGPVLDDIMDAICVTPVSPRSFFNRSIVFGADTVLQVENAGDRPEGLSISIDGTLRMTLLPGERIEIRRSGKQLRFLSLRSRNLLDVLCQKMNMQHF